MKDIDFDELDKAVSSVLSGAGKTTTAKGAAAIAPSARQEAVAAASSVDTIVVTKEVPPIVEPETNGVGSLSPDTPKIIPSPAVRRGRFMDVVHPSSDMTSPTQAPHTAPSSRSIAPLSSDLTTTSSGTTDTIVEKPAEPQPDEPKLDTIDTPTALDTTSPTPSPATEQIAQHPVVEADDDQTKPHADAKADEKSSYDDAPATPDDHELDDLVADTPPEVTTLTDPNVTPFLSDTKVDKRPLGAFTGEENASELPERLPQELDSKVLDIESREATEPSGSTTENVLFSPENTADDAQLQHMYNAETVHHALPAGKKKSGAWLWAVLIVTLLAVGSGLGYLWFVNGY